MLLATATFEGRIIVERRKQNITIPVNDEQDGRKRKRTREIKMRVTSNIDNSIVLSSILQWCVKQLSTNKYDLMIDGMLFLFMPFVYVAFNSIIYIKQ